MPQQTIVQMENVACGCWQETSAQCVTLQSLPLRSSVFNTKKITQLTGRKKEHQPKQHACIPKYGYQFFFLISRENMSLECYPGKMMPVTRDKSLRVQILVGGPTLKFRDTTCNQPQQPLSFLKSRGSLFGTKKNPQINLPLDPSRCVQEHQKQTNRTKSLLVD